ncbi:aminodeoxychorismate synthase component I [Microbacterium sp. SS28]|uniref:aminodeoxychorismate synthase component I n=1 Tax=Microbacterium sp. SS28 TaxID=2919948 RepID=UPI001FAB0F68|nr:aminodeoxychorismate synthase component I [Microbacterium sp. SS28]
MFRPLVATLLDEWIDPETVYLAGFAQRADSFWLDAGPGATTGWSWVGGGSVEPDPAAIRALACAEPPGEQAESGRFSGGWIGWLGYEDAAARAGAPTSPVEPGIPQQLWLRVERHVAFDHATRRIWAFAPADEIAAFARDVAASHAEPAEGEPEPVTVRARHEPGEYAQLVERCRDAIREGDAYQLCLTTRFEVDASVDPLAVYLRLRARTPAHHGGLIRSGVVALLSASPELFLEVQDGVVRTHPIKGTRPRGTDAASDAALAAELVASVKERAENVMIVDLMRNDLSRVSAPASVAVDRLFAVESYPAVHQLVSTVSGRLEAGTTVGGLLDAAFPAGSMTGAPKLSAMTILHELEAAPRGVFAGCFGWVGDDGALDLAMVIRSIVVHADGAYVGAGGGITWRSDASAEVAEVGVKARGPLAALGGELPPGW